ncbi:hypothetical protein AMS68_002298 [Peltaster fructicola]|uniref:Uncharacterized protein n=1 Tax=Peltaster fructicola TaxID=286661 RepID=A0A6H0XQ55_9PEZI|nr:hypothetical protein AMS68_002298 [Peltaster fructicola]
MENALPHTRNNYNLKMHFATLLTIFLAGEVTSAAVLERTMTPEETHITTVHMTARGLGGPLLSLLNNPWWPFPGPPTFVPPAPATTSNHVAPTTQQAPPPAPTTTAQHTTTTSPSPTPTPAPAKDSIWPTILGGFGAPQTHH